MTEVRNKILTPNVKSYVLEIVCTQFHASPSQILSKMRGKAEWSKFRRIVWYLLYHQYDIGSVEIARKFDRYHSTVLTGIKEIERLRLVDFDLDLNLTYLEVLISKWKQGSKEYPFSLSKHEIEYLYRLFRNTTQASPFTDAREEQIEDGLVIKLQSLYDRLYDV